MVWNLIIFDCDGVLVDTEATADRIFSKVLFEAGVNIPFDKFKSLFTGYTAKTCITKAEEYSGKSLPDDIIQRYEKRLFKEFQEKGVRSIPEIFDVLKEIPYQKCVASSGTMEKMEITLGSTGLLGFFENRIFCADDVERGKPFPDLFLYAAEKCGASPDKCAVIEDSFAGVNAGIKAGMHVFAYIGDANTDLISKFKKLGAETIFNMRELPGMLEKHECSTNTV